MSTSAHPNTFLCICTYLKGQAFLSACKDAGNTVFLLTSDTLKEANWPWDSIDEVFYMPIDDQGHWKQQDLISGLATLMRAKKIDRIVALDDFDVEKATFLREQFRIPGMGQTTGRFFRDKLSMRMRAQESNIPVPAYSALFNDQEVEQYAASIEPPWMIKPRSAASAIGITKVGSSEELWDTINKLGEERHNYLIERFAPGNVYHVDSLSVKGEPIFTLVSQYMDTPMDVAHGGGIFRSHAVQFGSEDDVKLRGMNRKVMNAFGMNYSASHTEFIKSKDTGEFFFLETSSRVGGAHIAEMVQASSGINLWEEWARIESAMARNEDYELPPVDQKYAGIIVSLSRFKDPDTSSFSDPEVWWRIKKDYHIGMIIQSESLQRVRELLEKYSDRILNEFHASAPAPDRPPE